MTSAMFPQTHQYPPMLGQSPSYEMEPVSQHMYPANYMASQPQVFLTTGQPLGIISSPTGPQLRLQNGHTGMYMTPPAVMHMPYAGDIHGGYSDMESARFQHPRSRSSTFSMNYPGQYPVPATHVGPPHDYSYAESCSWCRANHPGPHPPFNPHDMSSMNNHRHMPMDDPHSSVNKIRSAGYSHDGSMYDPFDWPSNRQGRKNSQWGYGNKDPKPRSSSQGPRGGPRRFYNNNGRGADISDDESDEDNQRGRITNGARSVRSTSRASRNGRVPMSSNPTFI